MTDDVPFMCNVFSRMSGPVRLRPPETASVAKPGFPKQCRKGQFAMKHLPDSPTSTLQPTMADVLSALDGKALSAIRRRDLASAVRRVTRMAGQEPNQVPLDMKVLSAIIERSSTNGKVPSPKTAQNLRSDRPFA